MSAPTLLIQVPAGWNALGANMFAGTDFRTVMLGQDAYRPEDIDYAVGFRPPHGLLKTLPRLKAVFSLGAGIDGFLSDPEFPKHVPLARFIDPTLAREMAQYVVMHTLIFHRHQRFFDAAQREGQWRQMMLPRATRDTRIGILGLGEIGSVAARALAALDFTVCGWSRTAKTVPGVKSFAGAARLENFLAQSDILVCLLPLTPDTRNILNAGTFAALPEGAFVINAARGGHLVEADLIAALDSGHLAGATLDVFQTEPLPQTSPLWHHPKITLTPHIAAISDSAAGARFVIDGIARAERGEKLPNLVDFNRGY